MRALSNLLIFSLILSSCSSKKDVLYFQDSTSYKDTPLAYQDITIQPNDILSIRVSALAPETVIPYNFQVIDQNQGAGQQQLNGYTVTTNHEINFPILGKINVENLTTNLLEEKITRALIEGGHLKDPTVNVRIINAKFTVLGASGGQTISFTDPNLTILQAMGMAGDLTLNSVRDDVLLIRETDGIRKVTHLDLTTMDITNSPYYYIKPNDVIYIKPNGPEIKKAGYIPSLASLLGIVSFTIGIVLLARGTN